MSKPLTSDEIEEELVNNDLLNNRIVRTHSDLNKMDFEEKKELLRGVKQSKETYCSEVGSTSPNPSVDISGSSFPSLPTPGARNNKLKLPRKQSLVPKPIESDGSSDTSLRLFDDVDDIPSPVKFSLPFCIDDDAPPLPMPSRLVIENKNPYYVMDGETPSQAFRRMLDHHNKWKSAYKAEMKKRKSYASRATMEELDEIEQRDSQKNVVVEEKENDPYTFVSNSPVQTSKTYKGTNYKERNPGMYDGGTSNIRQPRTLQRKPSRDSDCEEVEQVLKVTETTTPGEWIQAGSRSRNKRNRKVVSQEKGKTFDNNPNVEFDFDNKWEAQTSAWRNSQPPSSSSLNNQAQGRRSIPAVEEEKVECPICQRHFAMTKVEAHAATCEGYSGSPMDVEEGS